MFECYEFMLIVAQLYQGDGPHMLKVPLDTFHAIPHNLAPGENGSRLLEAFHGLVEICLLYR